MKSIQSLRSGLEEKFPGGFLLESAAEGTFILTVVDDGFRDKSRSNRVKLLSQIFERSGITPTIIELLTSDEAAEQGVDLSKRGHLARPGTWDDAIAMVQAGEHPQPTGRLTSRPRRVVFYSYKGGVGRTTALVHTAFHLARANKRVVIVDLDVEAPGVHHLVPPADGTVEAGVVDYLWERQVRPASEAPTVTLVGEKDGHRTGIAYAVRDAVRRNDVYVVPAGHVDFQYVQRLAVLTTRDFSTLSEGELDPWSQFERDVIDQFAPDIILIDARTGINDWGGLSLLRLADDAFIVMYPSVQNTEGVNLVRELLGQIDGARYHIVLSPVPEGDIGAGLIARAKSLLNLPSDGEESAVDEEDSASLRPIVVHYHPSIAAAAHYPVESAMAHYAPLANLLLDMNEEERVEDVLQKTDPKEIVESLRFPERDAKQIADADFEAFFQKTVDFDKLLDDARWVVRGRKGTGKSTLYYLFTQHKDNAAKRAGGKLVGINVLSGHGPAETFRPTTDIFQDFQRALSRIEGDWISFWRAYAVVRLFCSPSSPLDRVLNASKFSRLQSHLTAHFLRSSNGAWEASHTRQLSALFEDSDLSGLCRDSLSSLNKQLQASQTKIWLMYDDLDQDILEGAPWQQEALGGLLRLIYDTNNQDLHQIRFKVFLREDIWRGLVVTNKSHFGESRTLLLQWGIEDFLRLAYRLTTRGSEKFRKLAQTTLPLPDSKLDDADEATLRQALAPLWGLNQRKNNTAYTARWVYNRMTDTKGNTYPRSLTILLEKAREAELAQLKSGKPGSSDRLLRPSSLVEGLRAASLERCDALKNEYPDLVPFFDAMQSLRSQFKDEDLRPVWKTTAEKQWASYEKFVSQLEAIGLLAVRKESDAKYRYAVAALYIDGFNMRRVQGETA